MARLHRRRGEDGSALVMALLVSTSLSLVVAAILSFTDIGFKAKKGFDSRDRTAYSADGAVDAAINRFRLGNPCDDYSAPPVNGQTMLVRCQDLGSTGATANKPPAALLSLGQDGVEDGIASNSNDLRVRGNVYSKSTVNVAPAGTMVVEGTVSAVGACSSNVTATTKVCDTTVTGADPHGRDPDFVKALNTLPRRQTVPACGSGTPAWLVTLDPGYYDDAAALNLLTSGACPNSAILLRPGSYYFDFSFRTGAEGTWTINDATVNIVAGTPKGWSASAPAKPSFPVPGSCVGPAEQPSANGVQVVVGGTSHLDVLAGKVELCAQPSTTDQEIALYGLAPDRLHHVVAPTTVASSDGFSQATAANALTIGENPPNLANALTANASLNGDNPDASITFSGYSPAVVPGSTVDSAVLRVSHRDDTNVTATVSVGSCSGANKFTVGTTTTATEERFDLRTCAIDWDNLGTVGVTYAVDLATGGIGVDNLDGIWMEVAYRPPATRKPTGATSVTGVTAFTNSSNAFDIGEQPAARTADAVVTDGNPAAVVLSGFADPMVPPGSVIDSAVLRVAHHDPGNVASVSVTPSSAGCTAQALTPRPSAITEDTIPLAAACGGVFDVSKMAGLTIRYDVALTAGGAPTTVHLDGIRLEVVYRPHRQATAATIVSGFATQADADKAKAIDGVTADALLDNTGGPTSASVTLSGGFDSPTIPPGTTLDSAVLRVVHREGGDIDSVSITPSFSGIPAACATAQPLPLRRTALTPDTLDLKSCGLTEAGLAGLTATFTANLPATGAPSTELLDGVELEVAWQPTTTHKPAMANSDPADFANPDNALVMNEQPTTLAADATLTAADPTDTITLSGYGQPPLPPGSVVQSAKIRVRHQEDTGVVTKVAVPIPGCVIPDLTPQTTPGVFGEQTFDLVTTCGFDDASELFDTVTYTAERGTGADPSNAHLDGIELDLLFRPPTFEPLSGCLVAGPYPGAGACALVTVGGASPASTRFLVDGTVYAPSAAVDLAMSQLDSQVVTRGLVARTIRLDLSPKSTFKRPTIGVPNPESVSFTAYSEPIRRAPAVAETDPGVFTGADNAKAIDGSTADATVAADSTASMSVSGFGATPNRSLDSLVLLVAHSEVFTGPVTPTAKLKITSDSVPPTTCDLALPLRATPTIDTKDLKALCPFKNPGDLAGLKVEYSVTQGAGGDPVDAHLDGVALDVLADPLVRAQVAFDHGDVHVEGWSVLR